MHDFGYLDAAEFWRFLDEIYHTAVIESRSVTSYELVDGPGSGMIGSWSAEGARQVEYRDGKIHVLVQTEDPAADQGDPMVNFERSWADISEASETEDVTLLASRSVQLEVDGIQRSARVWNFDGGSWVSLSLGSSHVAIRSVHFEPIRLRLRQISDVSPHIRRRRDWVMNQRGEFR